MVGQYRSCAVIDVRLVSNSSFTNWDKTLLDKLASLKKEPGEVSSAIFQWFIGCKFLKIYIHVNEQEAFCTEHNDHKWNHPLNKANKWFKLSFEGKQE